MELGSPTLRQQVTGDRRLSNAVCVGFEVLTAVVMKCIVLWDITPCSPLKVNRRYREHIASIFRVE
jgi:hypothetical protein